MATPPSRLEANRLYWETDASVGEIAGELGVSRRALYELLDPTAADGPCPECGQALTFANRLARASGEALCRGCGSSTRVPGIRRPATEAADEPAPLSAPTARSRRTGVPPVPVEEAQIVSPIPDLEIPEWTSPVGIRRPSSFPLRTAGVLLVAVAAGVALAVIIRRRRR